MKSKPKCSRVSSFPQAKASFGVLLPLWIYFGLEMFFFFFLAILSHVILIFGSRHQAQHISRIGLLFRSSTSHPVSGREGHTSSYR